MVVSPTLPFWLCLFYFFDFALFGLPSIIWYYRGVYLALLLFNFIVIVCYGYPSSWYSKSFVVFSWYLDFTLPFPTIFPSFALLHKHLAISTLMMCGWFLSHGVGIVLCMWFSVHSLCFLPIHYPLDY